MSRKIAVIILMVIIITETFLIFNLMRQVKNEHEIRIVLEDNFSRKTVSADLEIEELRTRISEDNGKICEKDQTIKTMQEELVDLKERAKQGGN